MKNIKFNPWATLRFEEDTFNSWDPSFISCITDSRSKKVEETGRRDRKIGKAEHKRKRDEKMVEMDRLWRQRPSLVKKKN